MDGVDDNPAARGAIRQHTAAVNRGKSSSVYAKESQAWEEFAWLEFRLQPVLGADRLKAELQQKGTQSAPMELFASSHYYLPSHINSCPYPV